MAFFVLMVLLVGCTTFPPVLVGRMPCLPPHVSAEFLAWPVVGSGPVHVGTRDGYGIRYQQDQQAVVVLWVDGQLMYLDAHPDESDPPWVRTPGMGCTWMPWRGRSV